MTLLPFACCNMFGRQQQIWKEGHSERKRLMRSTCKLAKSRAINLPILSNLTLVISESKHDWLELYLATKQQQNTTQHEFSPLLVHVREEWREKKDFELGACMHRLTCAPKLQTHNTCFQQGVKKNQIITNTIHKAHFSDPDRVRHDSRGCVSLFLSCS